MLYSNILKKGHGRTAQRCRRHNFNVTAPPYVSRKCTRIGTQMYRVRAYKKASGAMSETEQEVSHFDFHVAFWCILCHFHGWYFNEILLGC